MGHDHFHFDNNSFTQEFLYIQAQAQEDKIINSHHAVTA